VHAIREEILDGNEKNLGTRKIQIVKIQFEGLAGNECSLRPSEICFELGYSYTSSSISSNGNMDS